MAFTIANRAFEEIFGEDFKTDDEIYCDFMDMLKDYLGKNKGESARKMSEWVENGNGLCTFTCRQDTLDMLCEEMSKDRIPYVLVKEANGKTGFIIRDKDSTQTQKTSARTIKKLSGYCRVTSGNEAGMTYLKGKDEDKTMLIIGALSREEAFYFAELCSRIIPGETVGVDHMPDGTYMVTGHAKTVMRIKKNGSYPGALAEAIVMMNGETGKEEREKVRKRLYYLQKKSGNFPDKNGGHKDPVWIVGKGNCFVKRTENGFDACHALNIDGDVILETDYTVSKDDKRYGQRMNSALSRTTDHQCLYAIKDVLDYYRIPKRSIKTPKEKGQQMFISQAARIVTEKTSREKLTRMEGKWEHKFRHYQKEMKRVIEGAARGKIPKGYTRADIIELRKTAKVFGLDLGSMAKAAGRYAELDSYAREAGRARVANIEQLIARYSGERQAEERSSERSRDTRSGKDR